MELTKQEEEQILKDIEKEIDEIYKKDLLLKKFVSNAKFFHIFEDLEGYNPHFIGYFEGKKEGKNIIINGELHERQYAEIRGFKYEYVNQTTNGGYLGDSYAGTIAYLWKGKYLQFSYDM